MLKPYEQRFPWNLDWNLLRTFMVVVEERSVSKAADFLGLKQPTISSALKRLEESVGHHLIERKATHFFVTPAGLKLYAECTSIFGTVSQLPALLDVEEDITGHVSILMASHVVSSHFDAILQSFCRDNPKVTYSIVVTESREVANRIRENSASLGICLMNDVPRNLDARILFREYFALYCGVHHRLFEKDRVQLSDLNAEPSVSFQTEIEGGPLSSVGKLRERAKLLPALRGVSANLPEIRRMIITNIGIGALPVHVAERDVLLGLLRQLPPYSRLPEVNIYLVTNPKRKLNAPEQAIINQFHYLIENTEISARTYGEMHL